MAIPVHARRVYEVALGADRHLNEATVKGRIITPDDVRDCVTAWANATVEDPDERQLVIADVMTYQLNEWTPDPCFEERDDGRHP